MYSAKTSYIGSLRSVGSTFEGYEFRLRCRLKVQGLPTI